MRCASLLIATVLVLSMVPPALAQEDQEVTLVIWGEPDTVACINDPTLERDSCFYARLLNNSWHEMNPLVKLTWEDHTQDQDVEEGAALPPALWEDTSWDENLRQTLTETILGGTPPDIIVGESFIAFFAQAGALASLRLSPDVVDNLVPGTVMSASKGGVLYGVAAFTNVFGLEVNADVLAEAGLDPDTVDLSTWEATAEVMGQVTEAGAGDFYGVALLGSSDDPIKTMRRVAPYLHQMGVDLCSQPLCDTPTFNDPNAVPVYEWFRTMQENAPPSLTFQGDADYIDTQIYAGLTAMQTSGAWAVARAEANECGDCRYYPLPYPTGGRRANVVTGNATYAVLDTSDHVAEATRFIEWLVSDPVQTAAFWSAGRLPTTYSAARQILAVADGETDSLPYFYENEMGKTKDEAIAFAAAYQGFFEELTDGEVYALPQWARAGAAMNQLWGEMFAEILTSDVPVQDILDEYQTQAEAIMAE